MLEVKDLTAGYGDVPVLHGMTFSVAEGELVALVGANAVGKTTTLRALCQLVPSWSGEVWFEGERLDRLSPHQVVERGIVQVPEGRRLFPQLSVRDNLELGAFSPRGRKKMKETLAEVLEVFPALVAKERQPVGVLSGGQQQMVAIGRALMGLPRLLLLDEPSIGLAPMVAQQIFGVVERLNKQGVTVMLVEQNVDYTLSIAHRGYVMEHGRVVMSGTGQELLNSDELQKSYLGM